MLSPIRALFGFLMRREIAGAGRKHRRLTRLVVEPLEFRRVLAASALPSITGTVFTDNNANGIFDSGEQIQGATVTLFQDDGDGVFDPGAGDVQVGASVQTDVNGQYCFDNLDQNLGYFVQQPAQVVGANNLAAQVSPLIQMTPSLIIDEFETTQSTVALPPPVSSDASALLFPDENEVIGAERDLSVELLAGMSEVQLRVNPFGLGDVLLFDSSAGSQGTREITWDGVDNDGDTLGFGLAGRDLTVGGTLSGITMRIGVDANGANARIRLYQGSAANFSEATIPIPATGGSATEWVFAPFSSFAGPVSAANVDAIQLILDTGNDSVDGQVDVIGVLGASVADFANSVQIDLELQKGVNAASVNNGDTVTWTLTLSNNQTTATAPATGVVVGDVLPAGVTFVTAAPSNGTYSNGTWTLSDPILPGDSETLVLTTTVDNAVAGGTVLANTAQVTAHDQTDVDSAPDNDDGDQSEDDEATAQVTVGQFIDLSITKVADTTSASAGDQVTFTVTITNDPINANSSATGVQVQDVLPAGLTLVSATPTGNGTFANDVWSLVDPLAPGASQSLSILATVDNGVQGGTTLRNVAEVIAATETDMDSTPNNDDGDQSEDDEAGVDVSVDAIIDLELNKVVNVATADAGDTVVWTLDITNNSANANSAATNVQVTDALPTGVTLVSAAPSGNSTFTGGVWSLVDPLQLGQVATLVLTTTVNTSVAGGAQIANDAEVSAADQTDADSTPANSQGEDDEASAAVAVNSVIDLELQKSANVTAATAGDSITWTLTLTNNQSSANADATGVQVSDVLPSGLTLVSATASNGTFASSTWTLGGPIAPGQIETLSLVTTVNSSVAGGTILENTAEVAAANEMDFDSAPGNDDGDQSEDDESADQVTITPVIDLDITKTVDNANASMGDTVTWTVVVQNDPATANTAATGVTVEDVLPAGVIFVSSTATNGAFDDATGVWTLTAPMAPGDSATLTLVTTVDDGTAGSTLTNLVQVASHAETDVDSQPGNDDGDQSQDDEDSAVIDVAPVRPMSKRALLASG